VGGTRSTHDGDKNTYKILYDKPVKRRELVRPWLIWVCNIDMNHREMGCECGLGSSGLGWSTKFDIHKEREIS
jgi:hypothetical protein